MTAIFFCFVFKESSQSSEGTSSDDEINRVSSEQQLQEPMGEQEEATDYEAQIQVSSSTGGNSGRGRGQGGHVPSIF